MSDYERIYAESLNDPGEFWARAAEAVHWYRRWDKVLDDSRPPYYRWFRGGIVNSCYNALDLHVANGRGDQAALIYDSPMTGTIQVFTYRDMLDRVTLLAGALTGLG